MVRLRLISNGRVSIETTLAIDKWAGDAGVSGTDAGVHEFGRVYFMAPADAPRGAAVRLRLMSHGATLAID